MTSDLPWQVIGIGSQFRGDDAFGLLVADYLLREKMVDVARVGVCHDVSKLNYLLSPERAVVIVDAIQARDLDLGAVVSWESEDGSIPRETLQTSTHSIGIADALEMAKILGNFPKKLAFVGVVGKEFAIGASCSDVVRARVPEIGERVMQCYLS